MTKIDDIRTKALRGRVEWGDIDLLLLIADASAVLLDELEIETGFWSNEAKEELDLAESMLRISKARTDAIIAELHRFGYTDEQIEDVRKEINKGDG